MVPISELRACKLESEAEQGQSKWNEHGKTVLDNIPVTNYK